MVRLARLLVLKTVLASTAMAQPQLSLEVDGRQFGVFTKLNQAGESPASVTLEQGWLSADFLDLWRPGLSVNGALEAGRLDFAGDCGDGRRVEVVQTLATGVRSRVRSWTLIGACPLWCRVDAREDDTITVTSLTLSVPGIGVAR